jgi:hypothetical protein
MATKIAAETRVDPQQTEFEVQKQRFEAAVAKTKAEGDTPPDVKIPETASGEPEPKPAKAKPKRKPESSALEQEVQGLKARIEELSKPKEPEVEEDDDRVDAVRGRLAERFGVEEADAMLESFNALREGDRREIAQMRHVLEEATKAGRANLSRTNQKRLASEHPRLKSKEAWESFHELALARYQKNAKQYESVEDAYDELAEALYGEEEADESAEAPEEIEQVASRIAASQMTPPSKSHRRESRSKEERAKEHFEFIKKNPDDLLGAKRLAKELGLR